ncbi:MAG: hypothetical protein HY336_02110 [Candidatus Doudnabacteria bacterium]|nr:hypothetical protein [Candidatus Doudnabacteria bacterium]
MRSDRPSKWQKKFLRDHGLTVPIFASDCERLIEFLKAGNGRGINRQRLEEIKKVEDTILGRRVRDHSGRIGTVMFLSSRNGRIESCVEWTENFSYVPADTLQVWDQWVDLV